MKIVFLISLFVGSFLAQAQISSVQAKGQMIFIYDEQGRNTTNFVGLGSLFGYSNSLIGTANGSHVYLYNSTGQKIQEFFVLGIPQQITSQNIISKQGKHVYIYNLKGHLEKDYFTN